MMGSPIALAGTNVLMKENGEEDEGGTAEVDAVGVEEAEEMEEVGQGMVVPPRAPIQLPPSQTVPPPPRHLITYSHPHHPQLGKELLPPTPHLLLYFSSSSISVPLPMRRTSSSSGGGGATCLFIVHRKNSNKKRKWSRPTCEGPSRPWR